MFCSKCGAQIPEGANNCPNCGANVRSGFEKVEKFVDDVTNKVDTETNKVINSVENAFNTNSNPYGVRLLKTDRSLLVFILLNFITCGIYTFFFIHSLAKDVNEACTNDNEKTPGVGMFILMWVIGMAVGAMTGVVSTAMFSRFSSVVQSGDVGTIMSAYSVMSVPAVIVSIIIGIYPLYWKYKLGNKLQRNGQQYGLMIPENGSTIIIWDIIGIICCCFCSWYAYYIIIKNANTICTAYNNKYVLNRS